MVTKAFLIVRICLFLLLLFFAFYQLRFAVNEQKVFLGQEANVTSSRDPLALTNQATKKHLFEADLVSAEKFLQRALKVSPYYIPAWLSLAELRNDQGKKEIANSILDFCHQMTEKLKWWRWEKTLTAYQLGKIELLPQELNYIIKEIDGKERKAALTLAFTIWPDPEELLSNIGEENTILLFKHAIANKHVEQVKYLWEQIELSESEYEQKDLLRVIDMFLKYDEVAFAGKIWRKHVSSEPLLFNGDFSRPLMKQAFGWRKGKNNDVEQSLKPVAESGEKNSLQLRFKGWNNVDYHHLYQIVPLPSGHYQLTAKGRTRKLTTDQLPYFEVCGYKCKTMTRVTSDMFEADQNWEEVSVNFNVPSECSAVVIRIRRNESNQLDAKISGSLWITEVAIDPLSNMNTAIL